MIGRWDLPGWLAALLIWLVVWLGGGGTGPIVPPITAPTPGPTVPAPSPDPSPTVPPTPVPTEPPAPTPPPTPMPTPTPSPTPDPTPTDPPPTDPDPTDPDRWVPPARVTWQWQLTGELDLDVDAKVFDVDLYTTSEEEVRRLHDSGRAVICYLSAGTYEPYRPDSAEFPAEVLGASLEDWPDERWLDVRQLDVLLPLMAARMDLCAEKGFDAVEPDNVDGYANESGFPLTAADQLTYNRELARLAHERGLAVALKNDLDQVAELEPSFDFAINEQCVQYDECQQLLPFIRAGKPVLHVEYELEPADFCSYTRSLGFSSLAKSYDLDAPRRPC